MGESRSGIYAITNLENDKAYIGSTIDFERRWEEHIDGLRKGFHCNRHLQFSWDKFGENTFEFGILEYLDNLEELVKAEQFWMDIYREEGKELYNFGLAADNPMRGREHSKETRQQMSASHLNMSPEAKAEKSRRISEARMGHPVSKETRCKLREAQTGKPSPMKGRKHSKESKQKIGEGNRGKPRSKELRRRISKAVKAAWARGAYDR